MILALAVDENIQDLFNIGALDDPAQPHRCHIAERDRNAQVAGLNVQLVILLHHAANRPTTDLLYYAYAVVGINDLVTDVEIVVH